MQRYFKGIIIVYTAFLLYMMFFGSGREASDFRYIQLNPFQTIHHFFGTHIRQHDFLLNIVGNIFVFSPFGWLGIVTKKFLKLGFLTLIFMLFIILLESTQYFTGRGTADIDDVLLNTVGMFMGFSLMKAFSQVNLFNFNAIFMQNEIAEVAVN